MGVSDHFISSLCCELRILEAKNIQLKSKGKLFIRYYIPAGNSKRIQLSTKPISTKSSQMITWNESFSLECSASKESVNYLIQQTVVFELRLRRKMGIKSVVLGRGEMPWKAVFESPNMEIDKYWVTMVSVNDRFLETDLKPPSIQISMKFVQIEKQKKRVNNWDECGCQGMAEGCNCVVDYEILELAAALEGLYQYH